ncbi:hypothetical protein [Mycolicibacterium hippocampi]|uniref:Uncharacterized protein n=1 Tax=Mycolicibacterium hippocampi TaxID=659824 RepID=A0A850PK90_9MYCO|nr:hypothetical protein [Mycolicibacterium hippocampi]NVN49157.1 hypothetical protein [Mycolicibacterium hippocampi]
MAELNPPEPFWRQERWWAKTGDDGLISRNQLIGRWRANIDLGDLDKKQFEEELAVWSSLLGKCNWVKDDYGPAAAEYASAGVNSARAGDDIWTAVSEIWNDYGDGLARYTLGLVAMAHARRPVVSGLKVDVIREPGRKAIRDKAVRARIVAQSRIESAESARAFLQDPSAHLPGDVTAVMHVYVHRLFDFAQERRDDEIAHAVSTAIDDLIEEFGEPDPEAGRDLSEEARRKAGSLLKEELDKKPTLYLKHRDDGVIGLASAKAIEFLARKIDAGKEKVEHAGIIHLTIRQVVADENRRLARERRRLASLEQITEHEERPEPVDVVKRGQAAHSEHEVEVRIIVEKLREDVARQSYSRLNLDGTVTPVTDFWEKDLALAILDGRTTLSFDEGAARLIDLFGDDWAQGRSPQHAVCFDARTSAAYVESMIRSAYTRVAVIEDVPRVFVTQHPDGTKRKARRLAARKQLLQKAKRSALSAAPKNEEDER